MAFLMDFLNEIWLLLNEMAPYLLLGFLLAGIMHVFVPNTMYHRYLAGQNMRSVVWAALFGVPLPLCSCGVIPTAMGLRREGASKGATVSFLIATPQTGVDSIIATYSLMGLAFAIVRPIAAMFTAIFGGWLTNKLTLSPAQTLSPASFSKGRSATAKDEVSQSNTNQPLPLKEEMSEGHFCQRDKSRGSVLKVLRYAFVEMMEDIGKWLIVGLIIAGLITAFVPSEWFAVFQSNSLLSILFVLLLSIPMYLCATGSIPIAVALMLKGLTPGAALVLLMAGPASNAASVMVINKVMGRKTLWVYLASIISGAILFGLGIDYLLPAEWFTGALHAVDACHDSCCEAGPGWFSIACSVLLLLLLLHAMSPWKLCESGCHCHESGCHCHEGECHCHDGGCHCHEDECHCHEGECHCHEGECHCHEGECHCHDDKEVIIRVEGMNCNHCAANVKKAIDSVAGVERSEVSLHEKEARVMGHFDEDEVLSAIRSLGFEAFL